MKNLKIVIIAFIVVAQFSCAKKKAKKLADEQHIQIENYVSKNNLLGQFTESGLWYSVSVLGTGTQPVESSTVKVVYSGYLLDNTPFDESSSDGATFSLSGVIKGWQEGIPKYKEGGQGKLIIPSDLAYGSKKVGNIPKNSILIFDIKLLEVL
jgi:FKBP-type peptidyl-prolyl cis-trans isomerase FkpA